MLTDAQLEAYRRRRREFAPHGPIESENPNLEPTDYQAAFYFSPALNNPSSTNGQNIPPVVDADGNPISLSEIDDDDRFRAVVALSFARVGLGAVGTCDDPPGRQLAYRNLITPFDDPGVRQDFSTGPNPGNSKSSCVLFIRGMWQLLGGGEPPDGSPECGFRQSYVSGVIQNVLDLTKAYDARTDAGCLPDPVENLRVGDVIFIYDSAGQHIFTVTELAELADTPPAGYKSGLEVYSTDGGMDAKPGRDLVCMGIQPKHRQLFWNGRDWFVDSRKVSSWINLVKMKASFTEPWILPYTP